MAGSRYRGPFVGVNGDDDVFRPTPMRFCWLLVGLLSALTLGFVLGMIVPRRRAVVSAGESRAEAAVPKTQSR